jgi:hypothetical protein
MVNKTHFTMIFGTFRVYTIILEMYYLEKFFYYIFVTTFFGSRILRFGG